MKRTTKEQFALLRKYNSHDVKVRGSIRARESEVIGDLSASPKDLTLQHLIEDLRRQVEELPLGVLIHGWGSFSAEQFYDHLHELLARQDALWLVPGANAPIKAMPYELNRVVLLNLNHDTDQRIYSNLVYDLVFFPALEETEIMQVTQLKQRSRSLVIDSRGGETCPIYQAGLAVKLMTYLWYGTNILKDRDCSKSADDSPLPNDSLASAPLDEVGRVLKTISLRLKGEQNWRSVFHAAIKEASEKYPDIPDWNKSLIYEAHEKKWPTWSVECLPSLYIILETLPDGSKRMLLWHYILACLSPVSEHKVVKEFCDKQVLEAVIPANFVGFIERIAPRFEANRLSNTYPSDRSSLGVVITSIIQTGVEYSQAPIGKILRTVVGRLEAEFPAEDLKQTLLQIANETVCPDKVADLIEAINVSDSTYGELTSPE